MRTDSSLSTTMNEVSPLSWIFTNFGDFNSRIDFYKYACMKTKMHNYVEKLTFLRRGRRLVFVQLKIVIKILNIIKIGKL